jgi:hypothetical protein
VGRPYVAGEGVEDVEGVEGVEDVALVLSNIFTVP